MPPRFARKETGWHSPKIRRRFAVKDPSYIFMAQCGTAALSLRGEGWLLSTCVSLPRLANQAKNEGYWANNANRLQSLHTYAGTRPMTHRCRTQPVPVRSGSECTTDLRCAGLGDFAMMPALPRPFSRHGEHLYRIRLASKTSGAEGTIYQYWQRHK